MAYTRKYESYMLVAEQVSEDFENYQDAYSAYCQQARYGNAATLYGRTSQGDVCVIMSRDED